ncbi:hypothetical protein GJ654_10380 [Rhodoblastus acidophilus]|uniref:Uncharacterized protein n=1 Tax=Rhodoblastus acidophilus TaxID=1074 RepID=A0A6N8DLJ8_RHOAC|nr:hypothetical protein [Rhodoblastus acidophilus]MCW2275131.1 hypothetical protein [Rhodoblastus acidophilus]MTV31400.1 hypothetical protein [Rhodoblastus acidophilus]
MSEDAIKIMRGKHGGFVVLTSPGNIGVQGEIMFAGDLEAVLAFIGKHFKAEDAK